MDRKKIEDISVQGRRVLVRVDFNVPLTDEGEVADDTRIQKTLPTLKSLIKKKARVILLAHLGRPKGTVNPKYSLKPVGERLAKLLNQKVKFVPDCVGVQAQKEIAALKNGKVALLENLRFHAEEEKNDAEFAKSLASLGDIYVNDAFGAAHRAHASTTGIADFLPAVAGSLLAKEIEYFDRVLENPKRPFTAILGGAKVTDKIKVIENLLKKVDCLLIGGAMAYTFLKARGHRIGSSMFDEDGFQIAKQILEAVKQSKVQLLLPHDHVIAETVTEDSKVDQCGMDIPEGWIGVDIGPRTLENYSALLQKSKTIVWNGPVGVFEIEKFSTGTKHLASCLAELKNVTTVIGGGETAAAVVAQGLEAKMSHVSTGGGASLEYLEGKVLPGVDALQKKTKVGK